jgi:hypothetical protein
MRSGLVEACRAALPADARTACVSLCPPQLQPLYQLRVNLSGFAGLFDV